MAREADCLVVCCPLEPLAPESVARILDALGPEGFLVNVARGPVVDEAALLAALANKRIAGAGLDVFWDEPRVPAMLMEMENVVLVPHIGSSTQEIREERGGSCRNLRAHRRQAGVNRSSSGAAENERQPCGGCRHLRAGIHRHPLEHRLRIALRPSTLPFRGTAQRDLRGNEDAVVVDVGARRPCDDETPSAEK